MGPAPTPLTSCDIYSGSVLLGVRSLAPCLLPSFPPSLPPFFFSFLPFSLSFSFLSFFFFLLFLGQGLGKTGLKAYRIIWSGCVAAPAGRAQNSINQKQANFEIHTFIWPVNDFINIQLASGRKSFSTLKVLFLIESGDIRVCFSVVSLAAFITVVFGWSLHLVTCLLLV